MKPANSVCPPLLAAVTAHPFFRGLSEPQLRTLAAAAMETQFEPGAFLVRDGDPANRFYLILEGQVRLESPIQDRESVAIQYLGAGDELGWSWLFPPYYFHADARAVAPTKAIFFYGTQLRELCENDHDLGYELMKRVAQVVVHRFEALRARL